MAGIRQAPDGSCREVLEQSLLELMIPDLIFTQVPTICKAPPRNTGIYLTNLSRPVPSGKYPKFVEDGVPGAHLGPATF